jgi:hypothetical protein
MMTQVLDKIDAWNPVTLALLLVALSLYVALAAIRKLK